MQSNVPSTWPDKNPSHCGGMLGDEMGRAIWMCLICSWMSPVRDWWQEVESCNGHGWQGQWGDWSHDQSREWAGWVEVTADDCCDSLTRTRTHTRAHTHHTVQQRCKESSHWIDCCWSELPLWWQYSPVKNGVTAAYCVLLVHMIFVTWEAQLLVENRLKVVKGSCWVSWWLITESDRHEEAPTSSGLFWNQIHLATFPFPTFFENSEEHFWVWIFLFVCLEQVSTTA